MGDNLQEAAKQTKTLARQFKAVLAIAEAVDDLASIAGQLASTKAALEAATADLAAMTSSVEDASDEWSVQNNKVEEARAEAEKVSRDTKAEAKKIIADAEIEARRLRHISGDEDRQQRAEREADIARHDAYMVEVAVEETKAAQKVADLENEFAALVAKFN